MSRRTRRKAKHQPPAPKGWALLKARLPQVLAGLIATGAISGTGAGYMHTSAKATTADERAAKVETRLDAVEKDAGVTHREMRRVDRRTTRIETMLEVLSQKHGVMPPPRTVDTDAE